MDVCVGVLCEEGAFRGRGCLVGDKVERRSGVARLVVGGVLQE